MSETQPFGSEDAFARYAALYDALQHTTRLEDLERHGAQIDDLENEMAADAKDPAAVQDLFSIIRSELSRKKNQLRKKRGKPARPDRFANLRSNLERLEAETRILTIHLESGLESAFVDSSLRESFGFSLTLVEADRERAEKDLADTGRTATAEEQSLLDRAAESLAAATALQEKLG